MTKTTRLRFAALAAFSLLASPIGTRGALAAQEVPAAAGQVQPAPSLPYPTHLRAAMRMGKVELEWIDNAAALGGYLVYRGTEVLNASSLGSAAKLGYVPSGVRSYIDLPPDDSNYYYLVLALRGDGTPYLSFVPSENATAAPISLKPAKPVMVEQPAAPAPALPPAPKGVEALSAQAREDGIVLSYKGGKDIRLVAYRGTAPIERASDLLDADLVATFVDKGGSFTDFPVPGIDYWYAILAEDEVRAGRILIEKGRNATGSPARVALTTKSAAIAEVSPASRTPPLPSFLLDSVTGTATPGSPVEAPERRAISPETEKAVASVLALSPPIKRPLPAMRLLTEELASPSGGEDYALSLIVTEKLVPGDWKGAVDQLRKYLSLNRGEKAASRAHFYMGQALAYSGASREAFFEFLSARALHPTETAPWIDYVLASLRQKG